MIGTRKVFAGNNLDCDVIIVSISGRSEVMPCFIVRIDLGPEEWISIISILLHNILAVEEAEGTSRSTQF